MLLRARAAAGVACLAACADAPPPWDGGLADGAADAGDGGLGTTPGPCEPTLVLADDGPIEFGEEAGYGVAALRDLCFSNAAPPGCGDLAGIAVEPAARTDGAIGVAYSGPDTLAPGEGACAVVSFTLDGCETRHGAVRVAAGGGQAGEVEVIGHVIGTAAADPCCVQPDGSCAACTVLSFGVVTCEDDPAERRSAVLALRNRGTGNAPLRVDDVSITDADLAVPSGTFSLGLFRDAALAEPIEDLPAYVPAGGTVWIEVQFEGSEWNLRLPRESLEVATACDGSVAPLRRPLSRTAECCGDRVDWDNNLANGCECDPSNGGVEICDGRDNDCDGIADGFLVECGLGLCRSAGPCVDGFELCTPGDPSQEVCDCEDNDCDGEVDGHSLVLGTGDCSVEATCGCYERPEDLPPGAREAGRCGSGFPCPLFWPPQGDPSPEVCDGGDNDCDGEIDEGCACDPESCG